MEAIKLPFRSLHFVGPETSYVWKGYMEGAVRSGRRGAAEVVAELVPGGHLLRLLTPLRHHIDLPLQFISSQHRAEPCSTSGYGLVVFQAHYCHRTSDLLASMGQSTAVERRSSVASRKVSAILCAISFIVTS